MTSAPLCETSGGSTVCPPQGGAVCAVRCRTGIAAFTPDENRRDVDMILSRLDLSDYVSRDNGVTYVKLYDMERCK